MRSTNRKKHHVSAGQEFGLRCELDKDGRAVFTSQFGVAPVMFQSQEVVPRVLKIV